MKLSALAKIVTLVATAIAKESSCVYRATDNPEVNLALHKWDNDECMGKSKALHRIEFGKCKNFDFGFASYAYMYSEGFWKGNDNDWKDCRCFLMVYPEAHCEGVPYCPGPVVDGLHWCHSLRDRPFGMSVKVRCDDDAETIRLNECRTSPDFEFLPPRPTSDHWW